MKKTRVVYEMFLVAVVGFVLYVATVVAALARNARQMLRKKH